MKLKIEKYSNNLDYNRFDVLKSTIFTMFQLNWSIDKKKVQDLIG